MIIKPDIDVFTQKRRKSNANALELRLLHLAITMMSMAEWNLGQLHC